VGVPTGRDPPSIDATPVLESCLEQIAQQPASGAHVLWLASPKRALRIPAGRHLEWKQFGIEGSLPIHVRRSNSAANHQPTNQHERNETNFRGSLNDF
jgi:hypothetical protein